MRTWAKRVPQEAAPTGDRNEAELAATREAAERYATAQANIEKLVAEGEQRAANAERRAAKAMSQFKAPRLAAEEEAAKVLADARRQADEIVSVARAEAEQEQITRSALEGELAAARAEIARLRSEIERARSAEGDNSQDDTP
ncbi:hypothetical protein [Nonomuraea sp. NEAU-A123]|uniref:hypothetical protein n=1 Tax=Nonomuraea sp. NEAU-A123 TaxID=2839649 RepID=UPI001BE4B792|nr:hypothetical protein [Nonomuraea sp. NEAU-A123]MBT2230191.1 hypothetical protein [Nonomuraea sp. NEAU-A123]